MRRDRELGAILSPPITVIETLRNGLGHRRCVGHRAGAPWLSEWFIAGAVEVLAVLVGVLLLEPLWSRLTPSFPIARISPAIMAPVDGPYYLANASYGYAWKSRDPLSLWFHPLVSAVLAALPKWVSLQTWFWFIGITSGVVCLALACRLLHLYNPSSPSPAGWLPWVLLAPGALGLTTGNAEIPTLCLLSLLVLSVLVWENLYLVFLFGFLAILTKPNALYMVPALSVYAYFAWKLCRTHELILSSTGIGAILLGWIAWMAFVDWHTGSFGSYWVARSSFHQYVPGSAEKFFESLLSTFLDGGSLRDRVRFISAIVVPLTNFWLIAAVPVEREEHRYAMFAGNAVMFAIALFEGNPNKIIVYTTTLPWHLPIHISVCQQLVAAVRRRSAVGLGCAGAYLLYCGSMLVVFILGTPLGWYY